MKRMKRLTIVAVAMFVCTMLVVGCATMSDVMIKDSLAHYFASYPQRAAEVNRAANVMLATIDFSDVLVTGDTLEAKFIELVQGKDLLPEDVDAIKELAQTVGADWYDSQSLGDLDPIVRNMRMKSFIEWARDSSARAIARAAK